MSLSVYDCSVPPFDDATEMALPLMIDRDTSRVPPLALRPLPRLFDTVLLSTITNTSGPPAGVKDTMPPVLLPDALLRLTDNFTPALLVPSARMPAVLLATVVLSMTAKADPAPVGLMKIPPPVELELMPFSLM